MNIYRDTDLLIDKVSSWLSDRLSDAGDKGGVFGLSGGVDSSLVALLLKKVAPDKMKAVIMPCHSQSADMDDARKFASDFMLPVAEIDLTSLYDLFMTVLPMDYSEDSKRRKMADINVKPRLRMITLYHIAQSSGSLVIGTGNRDEIEVGYFTKYGDGGVDLLPLGDLLKGEIWAMARKLGVPSYIVDKPPTAGLFPGQTDEEEMGVKYDELDAYLAGIEVAAPAIEKIERMRKISSHKKSMPQVCRISSN